MKTINKTILSAINQKRQTPLVDLCSRFINERVVQRGLLQNTVISYKNGLEAFVSFLNVSDVGAIKRTALNDFSFYLGEQGYSSATRYARISVAKAFSQWLNEKYGVDIDVENVEYPIMRNAKHRLITDKEMKGLFQSIDTTTIIGKRDRALISVLIDGCLRVSEALALRVRDVEIGEKRATVYIEKGKGDKERITYLFADSIKYLTDYLQARADNSEVGDNDYLFVSHGSTESDVLRRNSVNKILKKRAKSANIETIHPHALRRYGATKLIRQGVPMRVVSGICGHNNTITTMRYTQATDEDIENIFDRVGI